MITQTELKEIIHYNPDTGIFTWLVDRARNVKAGSIAGSLQQHGYIILRINYKYYSGHRLAWLYVYGKFPEKYIDHINGNPSDNRIENLREVTQSQNRQNSKPSKNNKSGIKNIYWNEKSKSWKVELVVNGKNKYLGFFKDLEEAKKVVYAAWEKYHGEYAKYE